MGFDMFSDPIRRTAMLAAVESGLPTTTRKVYLTGEGLAGGARQPGFVISLPHFRPGAPRKTAAQRQAALVGFVYSPLRANDFFSSFVKVVEPNMGVEIYDGDEINESGLLFRSAARPLAAPALQSDTDQDVGRHHWTVRAYQLPVASGKYLSEFLPEAILLGGIAGSLLLVGLGLALIKIRTRSEQLASKADELSNKTEELNNLADALKDSNAELQRFAYVASHDLRAPVRAIAGFAQVLQQSAAQKMNGDENDLLARVVRSARHMMDMIEGLLEYARVDSKPKEFDKVKLAQACNMALEMLQTAIVESGGRVDLGTLPTVMGDSVQFTQLFQNLVANALTYRSEAPPLIRISAERKRNEHVISVQDNSIGIAPESHEHIFEMFKRLHAQSKISGTGIGLATCRRIVERHGGKIWLESAVGKGSTFKFSLPAI
jgi:signal transduction histidine kinase